MRLNIRTQLLAGFAAVILVMVGSMAYAIYALSSLNHDANTIGKSAMPSSGPIATSTDGVDITVTPPASARSHSPWRNP